MKRALFTSAVAGVIVVGVVAGCDNVAGVGNRRVTMSLLVPSGASSNAAKAALQGAGGDPKTGSFDPRFVRIDAVRVDFSRVDLQRVNDVDDEDTDADSDSEDSDRDSDQRDNVHLRGDFSVNLPLGGLVTPVSVEVPFGTFDEVKLHVRNLHICGAVDDNRDGDFTDPGEIIATGNTPCVDVPVRSKVELDLDPPLVIDQNTDIENITIRLEATRFFFDRNGAFLDPRLLTTDKRLLARFRSRIRAAIRALEDANRNGENDRDTDSDR